MKTSAILTVILAFFIATVNAQESKKLTILHTNDLHSHLQGYAPESAYTPDTIDGDPTVGGMARIAGIISAVKQENPGSTLVVDGGDCLMGTLFHALETTTGFQLPLMKKAGYDVVALGNHDFDYGPASYAGILKVSVQNGPIPDMLLGNAVTDPDDPADDPFEDAFKTGMIKPYTIIERNGLKIGLFSLLGKDADESAPYAPPVTFTKIIKASKKLVKTLKANNCDIIICVSHSGVTKDPKGGWTGEDVKLAEKVKGIDLIISGHTHTLLTEPIIAHGIPIVQAGSGGQYVGRIDLIFQNGRPKLEKYTLIPVNDGSPADMQIQKEITGQQQVVNEKILKPLNLEYSMPVVTTTFPLTCEEYGDVASSNLGVLVADAIYYYMNSEGPGTDIAMVAAGVVRDPVLPGQQGVADIFRAMSLGSGKDNVPGYPLSRLWITGHELKNIIEILMMSAKSTPSHYCFYSHLKIEYNPDGGLFKKVMKIEFTNHDGSTVQVNTSKDDKKLYSIVANSYMLDFVGIIKKKSFGLINVVPKDGNGKPVTEMDNAVVDFNTTMPGVQEGKEWLALVRYLQQMGKGMTDVIPAMPEYYMHPSRSVENVQVKK